MSFRPLILLAPLDESRSSMSKCPNKYLEIAAAGSVGIYSNLYPYKELIQDGVNGFLVENQKEHWKEKILYLLQNRKLLEKIRSNSFGDIKKHFETEVVMPHFCGVIDSLIRGEEA
jgi:glycosyltransferase involved in cell wall biosynthesis